MGRLLASPPHCSTWLPHAISYGPLLLPCTSPPTYHPPPPPTPVLHHLHPHHPLLLFSTPCTPPPLGRFYMRPKAVAKAVLPTVRIRLRDATLRRTVLTILRGPRAMVDMVLVMKVMKKVVWESKACPPPLLPGCDLPTDFVDSIPVSEEEQRGQVGWGWRWSWR